ncbi:ABC transporter ATP-binding protein [Bradyrhizobium sp. USDA 3397]
MLIIGHDLRAARQVSLRLAVIYLAASSGSGRRMTSTTRYSPYTQALVSAIPHPRRRRTGRILLPDDPPVPVDRSAGCAFHRVAMRPDRAAAEQPPPKSGRNIMQLSCPACHRRGDARRSEAQRCCEP